MIEIYHEVDFLEALLSEVDPSAQRALIRKRRAELLNMIGKFEAEMDAMYAEIGESQNA